MAQSNESVKGNHYYTQCEYKTTLKYYIKQHVESEHVGIFYNCDGCGYKAKTKTYSFYNCDSCGYKATQKHYFYNCDGCGYKATQKHILKLHLESKHEGICYSCEQCGYKAK